MSPDTFSDLAWAIIGRWRFEPRAKKQDSGLAVGIAQNGKAERGATFAKGSLFTDGAQGFVDVSGIDDPFDLQIGSVAVTFRQDAHVGPGPNTLINRGEYADASDEGHFELCVTATGAIEVRHASAGTDAMLRTSGGFFAPGDEVRAIYSWNAATGERLHAENLTSGRVDATASEVRGLSFDLGDKDDDILIFAARETDDGRYGTRFRGAIDEVVVFNADVLQAGTPTGAQTPDLGYPGVYAADPDPNDDRDLVNAGNGRDLIETGDDRDTIDAGNGRDTVHAGVDDDEVRGGNGRDLLFGDEGNDLISGGNGNDTIFGFNDAMAGFQFPQLPDDGSDPAGEDLRPDNDRDTISGGNGNDVIFGGDDADHLLGDAGRDWIDGGLDDDLIRGGTGNDTLFGGQGGDTLDGGLGADRLSGGADADTFTGLTPGDTIDGGGTGRDFDTMDLRGSAAPGHTLRIETSATDPESGTVFYFDSTGTPTGELVFTEIENTVPCFTPETLIATPKGEVPVETLRAGDRVITRDNGVQEIRWAGAKGLTGEDLKRAQHLRPVRIRKGALGGDLPERDMLVSPNHRILVANSQTALYFEDREVLVAAKHLTGLEGVDIVDVPWITYIHILLDRHEVILSDGCWTESFQPGEQSLGGIGNAQRTEIFELFPELASRHGVDRYPAARQSLKRHEARLLTADS